MLKIKITKKGIKIAIKIAIGFVVLALITFLLERYFENIFFSNDDCELSQIQIVDLTFTDQGGVVIPGNFSLTVQSNTGDFTSIDKGKTQINLNNLYPQTSKYRITISNQSESITESIDLEKCEQKGNCSLCHYPDPIVIPNKLLKKANAIDNDTKPTADQENDIIDVVENEPQIPINNTKKSITKESNKSTDIKEVLPKKVPISSPSVLNTFDNITTISELEVYVILECEKVKTDRNKQTIERIMNKFQGYKAQFNIDSMKLSDVKERWVEHCIPLLDLINKTSDKNE